MPTGALVGITSGAPTASIDGQISPTTIHGNFNGQSRWMEPSQKKVYGPDLELTVVNFGPGLLVVRAADYQDAIRLLESVEK